MHRDLDVLATAQQQAYRYIREQILNGRYTGGMRLQAADIAAAVGVSRMPVREALRQLDSEGLVMIRPNRGAVVTELTAPEIEELFEMRAVFEALAARSALPHLTSRIIEELEFRMNRLDQARGDPRRWLERHNDFHDYLCQQSNRPRLTAEINRLRTAVQPYLLMYINVYVETEMEGYEHATLMKAVRSGDSDRLETAMRHHVLSAARGIMEFVEKRVSQPARALPRKRAATG